ncbi:MAG TPA: HAMP domain-containing sensor histidine kinase [Chloroflexia bacterium]|nr:HAMP domain-containing sensor histidine kinase [Chloroflexia bacterium]
MGKRGRLFLDTTRSLRFRLMGWYVMLLLITLVLFSVYIFFQFRNLEQNQQDTTLQATTSRILSLVEPGLHSSAASQLHFHVFSGTDDEKSIEDLNRENIQVRLIGVDGSQLDSLGSFVSEMPLISSPDVEPTLSTLATSNGAQWRVLTTGIAMNGRLIGWIELGQSVYVLDTGWSRLITPIIPGTIVALLLAILGGFFLASKALNSIDRFTRTAQAITTRDPGHRINYSGPQDEIGRLASTLDHMLERLEKGFEQERRFTSNASHELRTPLSALKGRIEVTLSRKRTPEEYRKTLVNLNEGVDRLIRLSNSLLYLSRLDQSEQNWEEKAESINLTDLLESMAESMQIVAEMKEVDLSYNIPTGFVAQGHLDQLTRLFLNLTDNAIKHTPACGKVKIAALERAGQVQVTISDTGPGIAQEHLPHLFERFYRVESDRATSSGGAGLGLAIASEIARQHKGKLHVESHLGQGTIMIVELPLRTFQEAGADLKAANHNS